MKSKPTFQEAIRRLLEKHKNVAGAARWLGMTPQNLKRVMEEDGGKALERTREWVCLKVWEEAAQKE